MNSEHHVHRPGHRDEGLSLGTLSAMAWLSPADFHISIPSLVGETPRSYIAGLRLELPRSGF